MAEAKESRFKEALTFIGTIIGWFSGVAGIFAIVGYVIILAFAKETGIYGRVTFTQQLPFESLFTAVYDWIKFCWKDWNIVWFLLPSSAIVGILFINKIVNFINKKINSFTGKKYPLLDGMTKKDRALSIISILGFIVGITVFYAIGKYNLKKDDALTGHIEILLYLVAIPILFGLFIVLISRFNAIFPKPKKHEDQNATDKPKETIDRKWYYATAGVSLAILLLIPFLYGAALYDLPVYKISEASFNTYLRSTMVGIVDSASFSRFGFYFLGQTGDQCLFLTFDRTLHDLCTISIPKDKLPILCLSQGKKPTKRNISLFRYKHINDNTFYLRPLFKKGYKIQNFLDSVSIQFLQKSNKEKRIDAAPIDKEATNFLIDKRDTMQSKNVTSGGK